VTPSIASLERSARPTATQRSILVAAAAAGTLLISRLPEIVLRETLGVEAPWLALIPVSAAAALWVGTAAVAALRPLSGFFGVMTGVLALIAAIEVLFTSAAWESLAPASAGPMVRLLSERLVLGALALAIVAALTWRGGDSATYLRLRTGAGDPDPRRRARAIRWRRLGPLAIVVLVGLTALAAAPLVPASIDLAAAAPFLVMAAIAAGLNALWEEVAFRAAPMGRLAPAVGAGPAIVLLAAFFGLGHFYGGMPSGLAGAAVVGMVGLVLGRAMADTRGLAWPWAIHASIDLTIYVALALAATAPA
jgi:membrane protease YdiL (CAAX protease family)